MFRTLCQHPHDDFASFVRKKVARLWPVLLFVVFVLFLSGRLSFTRFFLDSLFLQCVGFIGEYKGIHSGPCCSTSAWRERSVMKGKGICSWPSSYTGRTSLCCAAAKGHSGEASRMAWSQGHLCVESPVWGLATSWVHCAAYGDAAVDSGQPLQSCSFSLFCSSICSMFHLPVVRSLS